MEIIAVWKDQVHLAKKKKSVTTWYIYMCVSNALRAAISNKTLRLKLRMFIHVVATNKNRYITTDWNNI